MVIHRGFVTFLFLVCLVALTSIGTVTASEFDDPPRKQRLIVVIIEAAGPVFGPLLEIVLIALVTLIVLLTMDLRTSTTIPPYFVEVFTDAVNKRNFREAFELARHETSFLGRVLTGGMSRLQYGIDEARTASLECTDAIKRSKEKLLGYLATLSSLGPMLGAVAALVGMTRASGAAPEELAKGTRLMVVVTLFGVALTVPAVLCHAFFRNRLAHFSSDVTRIADDLLTQIHQNSRGASGGGGGFGAPGPDPLGKPSPTKPPPIIFPASGSAEP